MHVGLRRDAAGGVSTAHVLVFPVIYPYGVETHNMRLHVRRHGVVEFSERGGDAYYASLKATLLIPIKYIRGKSRDDRHKLPPRAEKSWLSRRVKYIQKFCLYIQKFCFYLTRRDNQLFSASGGTFLGVCVGFVPAVAAVVPGAGGAVVRGGVVNGMAECRVLFINVVKNGGTRGTVSAAFPYFAGKML